MHRHPFFAASGAVLLITGCAVFPSTPVELREREPGAARVCATAAPAEVAAAIEQGWQRCYGMRKQSAGMVVAGGTPIVTGPLEQYSGIDVAGSRHTVVMGADIPSGRTVVLIADVEPTASCPAEVVTRGVGPVWAGRARAVGHFVSTTSQGCPP